MPGKRMKVMTLRYADGFSTEEIARQLGVAPPTVRVHLADGRRQLRHEITKLEGPPSGKESP
jgi:DNA-directed RNA polymerase specialized sigma24 family protein